MNFAGPVGSVEKTKEQSNSDAQTESSEEEPFSDVEPNRAHQQEAHCNQNASELGIDLHHTPGPGMVFWVALLHERIALTFRW
jgi:hypothetical protein